MHESTLHDDDDDDDGDDGACVCGLVCGDGGSRLTALTSYTSNSYIPGLGIMHYITRSLNAQSVM